MRVHRNIAANFAGSGLTTIIAFTVLPLYLRMLGAEAYGLVGLYTTLAAATLALDLGLAFTFNRELARVPAEAGEGDDPSGVVFTLQAVCWTVALAIGALAVLAAPWVAQAWLSFSELSVEEVTRSLRLMAAALPLIIARNFYAAGLNGLQRQGWTNVLHAGGAAMRAAVTIGVLHAFGPQPSLFFVAQVAVLCVETAVAAATLWRVLPPAARGSRLRGDVIAQRARFSAGVASTMSMGLALAYMDQAVLSRVLPLSEFGYYTIACTLAGLLGTVAHPVSTAVYPHFSQLSQVRDSPTLRETYHLYSQTVAVLVLPLGAVLAAFPHEILSVWTGNVEVANNAALVLALRSVGTSLNALLHVPHVLQLAFAWSGLAAVANAVALVVAAPATLALALRFGGAGAASAWVGLNAGWLASIMPRMHSRLLHGELARWYGGLLAPAVASTSVALLSRGLAPGPLGRPGTLAWIIVTYAVAALAALTTAPQLRRRLTTALARSASTGVA